MSKYYRISCILCAVGLAIALSATSGCKRKSKGVIEPDMDAGGTGMESTTGEGQPGLDLESLLFSPDRGLKVVYFDYDSSALRADALATLRENAEKIKQAPGVIIQVAGHCDERGTQEYNLALGERRALSVRDHLIQLGVSGDRLVTISFGEEFPAVDGHDESAWRYNRRVEFNRAQAR
ncbi:MAG TPA: OmpA family protein [Candidatus Hydrogenedentes bacterium]|nr:OmpA family protein [Candidatus Hydrogenedentota bacterium]HNT87303.1 OmpA family protein [Candidatus Hydrogenedentota bacterium]